MFNVRIRGSKVANAISGAAVFDIERRMDALRGVLSLVRDINGAHPELPVLETELAKLQDGVANLSQVEDRAGPLSELERRFASAEDTLMAVGSQIPLHVLRTRLAALTASDVQLIGFVRLLEPLRGTDAYYDRFELIMTRLFRSRDGSGVRPYAEVSELLLQLLTCVACSPQTRQEAIEFFRAARARTPELATIDAIFDTGFYVDVEGYKIALKADYFDPEVLCAAVELNIALGERIQELVADNEDARLNLMARFDEARATVRDVFREQFVDLREGLESRAPSRRPSIPPDWIAGRSGEAPRSSSTRNLQKYVMVVVLVVGLGFSVRTLHDWWGVRQRDLSAIDGEQLAPLSPYLLSGAYGGSANARVFVGKVESGRWLLMSQTERHQVLLDLWKHLDGQRVRSVMLYREDILVGQIADGRLYYAE